MGLQLDSCRIDQERLKGQPSWGSAVNFVMLRMLALSNPGRYRVGTAYDRIGTTTVGVATTEMRKSLFDNTLVSTTNNNRQQNY